jgi:hypothetical protein
MKYLVLGIAQLAVRMTRAASVSFIPILRWEGNRGGLAQGGRTSAFRVVVNAAEARNKIRRWAERRYRRAARNESRMTGPVIRLPAELAL